VQIDGVPPQRLDEVDHQQAAGAGYTHQRHLDPFPHVQGQWSAVHHFEGGEQRLHQGVRRQRTCSRRPVFRARRGQVRFTDCHRFSPEKFFSRNFSNTKDEEYCTSQSVGRERSSFITCDNKLGLVGRLLHITIMFHDICVRIVLDII